MRSAAAEGNAFDSPSVAQFLISDQLARRTNSSYLHFWADDFLPSSYDSQLRAEYPTELMLNRLKNRLSVNLNFHDGSVEVKTFLEGSPAWRRYHEVFTSREWLAETIRTFRGEFVRRYPLVLRPLLAVRVLKPSNLEVTVALSFSRKGFLLAPHSDDKFKLLTLIHYLPVQTGAELSGGTGFFLPRQGCSLRNVRQFSEWSRGLRRYLPFYRLAPAIDSSLTRRYEEGEAPNPAERARFEALFERGDYVEYRTNRISGFVKNNWTFHEVDLSDFPEGEFRRAALVNIRLRPTRWADLIPTLERVLTRVKQSFRRSRRVRGRDGSLPFTNAYRG
jgi:hypothetical protein